MRQPDLGESEESLLPEASAWIEANALKRQQYDRAKSERVKRAANRKFLLSVNKIHIDVNK